MIEQHTTSPLDKKLPAPGWFGTTAIAVLIVAAFVRFWRLDQYLLNVREANWAYDAFSLFYGRPLPEGEPLPDSSPFMLVWNALSFFLFGVTDASARVGSAVLGLGLIALFFLLRPFFSKSQILGITGILAISPTVVFASRTIEPGIAAAFFAVLILVALLRGSIAEDTNHGWAILLGVAITGLYATGPLGVTTLIALIVAATVAFIVDSASRGRSDAVSTALKAIALHPQRILWMLGGLVVTLLVLFTRMLSDLSALAGVGSTMLDWVDMMSTGVSDIPAVFYFWSLMLYETIAVGIAFITAIFARRRDLESQGTPNEITSLFLVIWFAVALLLHTLASTRDTGSAVLVVLPVLILAGSGLGRLFESGGKSFDLQKLGASLIAAILVVYSVNAMVGLAFTRGESGKEPLAHDTPSAATREFIDQVMRLSRDISVYNYNPSDPTGHFGLTIQVTPQYEWPFTWYFREFQNFSVSQAGAFNENTDVAIAANADVMTSVGLDTFELNWIEKPGELLTLMDSTQIMRTGLNPTNWGAAWDYMIHREAQGNNVSRHLTVGYGPRVMDKINTISEPVGLFDENQAGPQIGPGQLNHPGAIAIGDDGTIYIANAMNNRIDLFSPDGVFLESWTPERDSRFNLGWQNAQGSSSMTTGPDGMLYIADTWNHVVLILTPSGEVAGEIGERGNQADITDEGDPQSLTGLFFGPRGVAVSEDRIYVTDTGNERVQMFQLDGSFVGVFGGFGSEDGQFLEPTGIAIDSEGSVWVADSGNARMQKFSASGEWISSHHISILENQFGIERYNMMQFGEGDILYFTTYRYSVWAWSEGDTAQPIEPNFDLQKAITDPSRDYDHLRAGDLAITADGEIIVTRVEENRVDILQPIATQPVGTPAATPEG